MSVLPEPAATRGDITLQPTYFTSSLFVDTLREDVSALVEAFSAQYQQCPQPFSLFKRLWNEQGWSWLHLRAFDARARSAFIHATERVFVERVVKDDDPVGQIVGLFALYTFHSTQPSPHAPPLHTSSNIPIPIDYYQAILDFSSTLTAEMLQPLVPYVIYVTKSLLEAQVFLVLPHSRLRAQTPTMLPREIFVTDEQDLSRPPPATKKKGRPSKRDRARKVKDALASLEKYVEKNTTTPRSDVTAPCATHPLLGQAPNTTLRTLTTHKTSLLAALGITGLPAAVGPSSPSVDGVGALQRANDAVLLRLRQIDAMAAEKGLEVGGEGGEKTGLFRVENVVRGLHERSGIGAQGGILSLLDGAGIEECNGHFS